MKLIEIQNVLENWSPLKNAEEFDNVGLIVGESNSIINKAIITLDTTEQIIDEAIDNGCNLIITFHPLMYKGNETLKSEHYVDKIIVKALKNNINIYAIHTNLDNNPMGVSFQISEKLGLKNREIMIKRQYDDDIGMGMIGTLENKKTEKDFLNYLKDKMEISNLRYSDLLGKSIKKIGVLGGSGSFGIEEALNKNIDCYITADLKYHDFFKANNKLLLVDIGHYESEKYTKELILNYLNKKIPKFACIIAKSITNPVNYY